MHSKSHIRVYSAVSRVVALYPERENRLRRDSGDTAKTLLGVEGAGQRSAAVCGSRARITLLLSEFSRAIDTSLVNRVICVPEQAIQTIYTTRLTDR